MTGRSLTQAERKNFHWLDRPALKNLMQALHTAKPGCARYVGGCVRDALLGLEVSDFDIATQLTPDETIAAFAKAGIRTVPTGIDHGTVTAIHDGQVAEVTSLRADIATDGRHAQVSFTRDWAVDAARRDFTINALYLDPEGMLYDEAQEEGQKECQGLTDLAAGKVRFIGNAEQRIREDYLRILRFFRFSARFATNLDPDGLVACSVRSAGLATISRERVGAELRKILPLPRALMALSAMDQAGVLVHVWPENPKITVFGAAAIWRDEALALEIGLAALWPQAGTGLDQALRSSKKQSKRRLAALVAAKSIAVRPDETTAKELLYRHKPQAFQDGCQLARARQQVSAKPDTEKYWTQLFSLPERWDVPTFPISGKHLQQAGIQDGPQIGATLAELENSWIAAGFPAGKAWAKAQIQAIKR